MKKIHFLTRLLSGVSLFALSAMPVRAQASGSQAFNCTASGDQVFTVPNGVTSITAMVHGAHGSDPDKGARGGFGGFVQGDFAVTPGQTLFVWVGCNESGSQVSTFGLGSGGSKGTSSECGDGGYGGGGSAVTLDFAGTNPLLVAGGGGGGGGGALSFFNAGGEGGDGGMASTIGTFARAGQAGESNGNAQGLLNTGGPGGCAGCVSSSQPTDGTNGQSNHLPVIGGCGGGGGGGGFPGGKGGGAGGSASALGMNSGGGGGGGGNSYLSNVAIHPKTGWSQLALDGLVTISWPADAVADTDHDGIPDSVDKCPSSDRKRTVVIRGCNSGVINSLEANGCTLNDQIAKTFAPTTDERDFAYRIHRMVGELELRHAISTREGNAILDCIGN